MISKMAYYWIIKDIVVKNYEKKELVRFNLKTFEPSYYPALIVYLEFLHYPNVLPAIHLNDMKQNVLYYVNFDLAFTSFIHTPVLRKILLNIQLPDEVGEEIRIVFTNGLGDYQEIGWFIKKNLLWEFYPSKESENLSINLGAIPKNVSIFFVGGAPKSGTTWVEIILNHHPNIICTGEGGFFEYISRAIMLNYFLNVDKRDYIKWVFPKRKPNFEIDFIFGAIAKYWFNFYIGLCPEIKAIGDRTPNNARNYDKIYFSLSDSQLIHVIRNPLDVCVSMAFHEWNLFRTNKSFLSILDNNQLLTLDAVIKSNTNLFKDLSILDKFLNEWIEHNIKAIEMKEKFPDKIIFLKYEDLQHQTYKEIHRMFNFLNVSTEPSVLSYIIEASSFERLSGRKKGVEDRTSFFRKGIVGDWKNYMSEKDIKYIFNKTKDFINYFGYNDLVKI